MTIKTKKAAEPISADEITTGQLTGLLVKKWLLSLYEATKILVETFIKHFTLGWLYVAFTFSILGITDTITREFLETWFNLYGAIFWSFIVVFTLAIIFIQFSLNIVYELINLAEMKKAGAK